MGLFSKKSAPQPSARPEYIEVGQIVNTHGVRGEVKVQPWDVSPELLCGFKTFYMDGAPFRPTSKRVQGDPHTYIGTVVDVLSYPAHKLYKVKGEEKTYLIPAVKDIFITDIDEEAREISVHMIEGLETDED